VSGYSADPYAAVWQGRAPRSIGAANVGQVEDAIAVLRYVNNHPGTDFSLRTVSVLLFGDSKRLERLRSPLDVLTASNPMIPRHRDEVFGELGLLRAPQPMLIAGPGNLIATGGCIPLIEPYVGLAPSSVVGLGHETIATFSPLKTSHPFMSLLAEVQVRYRASSFTPAVRRRQRGGKPTSDLFQRPLRRARSSIGATSIRAACVSLSA